MRMRWGWVLLLSCGGALLSVPTASSAPVSLPAPAPVLVLVQRGAIGPASADAVHRGLARAAALRAQLAVIELDTPGGLDTSMRAIIQDILASPVPVATYVAPPGARAASAGTYILYASHVAAMAPATNLGAATPVSLLGHEGAAAPAAGASAASSATGGEGDTMARKVRQDAAAYIRGLAQLRGRNAAWGEQAVREAASLSAAEALRLGVIDLEADDLHQLLVRLDGRRLSVNGREVTLATAHAPVLVFQPGWRTRLLAVVTDPSVAYVLLLLGVYGLFFEFYNPGAVAPGVIGAISLLVAAFAFQLLPVSFAGLALILLGLGLLVTEHVVGGFGAFGVGGAVAFAIGSLLLIEPGDGGGAFRLPWPLVATATAVFTALVAVALGLVARARRRPVVSGREALRGAEGRVVAPGAAPGEAVARLRGELWQVRAAAPLAPGARVRVTAVDGLVLAVEPCAEGDAS